MKLRRRYRSWIALVALLGLLFQQLAVAAYVCPVDTAEVAALDDPLPPCHRETPDPARCHAHCHPATGSLDQAQAPTVPPLALAPAPVVFPEPLHAHDAPGPMPALRVSSHAPPLNELYCTYLI